VVCGDCDCENGFARNVADVVNVVNVVHGFCDILCRRCRRRRDGFVGHVWVDKIREFLQFLHILHRDLCNLGIFEPEVAAMAAAAKGFVHISHVWWAKRAQHVAPP